MATGSMAIQSVTPHTDSFNLMRPVALLAEEQKLSNQKVTTTTTNHHGRRCGIYGTTVWDN